MSKILQAEIASVYGALDTNAVIDGDASHAHVLRELARSTNRLIDQSSPVLNLVFDASTDSTEAQTGAFEGYLSFYEWRPVVRGSLIVPKKAHHRTLNARLIVKITSGKTADFQVSTTQQPFDPSGDASTTSTVTATGTGAWQVVEIDGIAAGAQETEQLVVWVRGSLEGTTANASTYGGPVSNGSVAYDFVVDTANATFLLDPLSSASWNRTGGGSSSLSDDGRFSLILKTYTTRALLLPPLRITHVSIGSVNSVTGPIIFFDNTPTVAGVSAQRFGGGGVVFRNQASSQEVYFEITELCEYRLANVSVYSEA